MSYLIVDIENTFLNLLIDLFCGLDEGVFNVICSFGRCFHEDQSMFLRKRFAFLFLHLTTAFQVAKIGKKISQTS